VPRIAGEAAQVDLYQRTPPVGSSPSRPASWGALQHKLYRRFSDPAEGRSQRESTGVRRRSSRAFVINPKLQRLMQKLAEEASRAAGS